MVDPPRLKYPARTGLSERDTSLSSSCVTRDVIVAAITITTKDSSCCESASFESWPRTHQTGYLIPCRCTGGAVQRFWTASTPTHSGEDLRNTVWPPLPGNSSVVRGVTGPTKLCSLSELGLAASAATYTACKWSLRFQLMAAPARGQRWGNSSC